MWTLLKDCKKQIIPHIRLREINGNNTNIYEVTMIEFDQYHLQLLTRNNIKAEEEGLVLKCDKLMEYAFEIEAPDENK